MPVSVMRTIGVSREVDERHVRLVERLVVAGDERRPLLAEAVVLRDQPLRGLGIVDDAADLLGDELAPLGVRRRVEQQVGVVARELREAGAVPHLLEERPPLLLRVVERGAVVHAGGGTRSTDVFSVSRRSLEVGPELRLLLGGDRRVVERRAPVGGALVHGERRDLVGDGRDRPARRSIRCRSTATRLPAKSTGVAGHRPVWCCSPRKSSRPGHVGEVRHREHAGRGDEEPRPELGAVAERRRSTCPTPRRTRPTVTVASNRMWRRRSNRSTTWLR